jgi:quinol monooxygenase YgiN
MIFITAKFQIRPEDADQWPQIAAEFTEATRSEPGCLWFDWSRSLADPEEYVLVEAFRDGDAGAAHVQSDHFKKAQQTLPPHLARTPGSSTSPSRRTTGPSSARWPSPIPTEPRTRQSFFPALRNDTDVP